MVSYAEFAFKQSMSLLYVMTIYASITNRRDAILFFAIRSLKTLNHYVAIRQQQ